ncbi:MAG: DUF3795 domain-containing protein [Spirochaetes bacterium]|nr:DUF3795 domain-containing protein [Spirochaetota bacterium]
MENPEKNKVAYCGLFCGACEHFIKTEAGDLESLAARTGTSQRLVACEGCRSKNVSMYCINCSIKKCAIMKNIEHCGDCDEFPCSPLKAFAKDGSPHHEGLIEDLEKLKKAGMEKYIISHEQRWSCGHCGRKYSWYQPFCDKCKSKLNAYVW